MKQFHLKIAIDEENSGRTGKKGKKAVGLNKQLFPLYFKLFKILHHFRMIFLPRYTHTYIYMYAYIHTHTYIHIHAKI